MSTTLFQDGDWRIRRTGHLDIESIIQHKCEAQPRRGRNDEWWHITTITHCLFCQVKVPDGILGLHTLHNWDRP